MKRPMALLIALLASILFLGSSAAQTSPAGTLPVTPDPAECGVSPRDAEDVAALLVATTGPATPAALTPVASPTGELADRSTTAFVISIVREALACGNGSGFLGAAAMATDNALAHAAAANGDFLTFVSGEPAPAEGDRRALIDVREVRDQGDGRVSARVVVADPTRAPADRSILVVLVGGGEQYLYLIDEVVPEPDGSGAAEVAGTPAP